MLPEYVIKKLYRKLWTLPTHPMGIISQQINQFFKGQQFTVLNEFQSQYPFLNSPYVTVKSNFDSLLIPKNHISRSPSDTFYVDDQEIEKKSKSLTGFRNIEPEHLNPQKLLLRTHSTAHQSEILQLGMKKAIWTVDVFRKDEVNAKHSPVFHQTDGISITTVESSENSLNDHNIKDNLHDTIIHLIKHLLGNNIQFRWNTDYFPFTDPSYELEIQLTQNIGPLGNGLMEEKWMEVLGCGLIKNELLQAAGFPKCSKGWAFGIGLERLVMLMCQIPDIRLFWSEDPRFTSQYTDGNLNLFKPYSAYPETVRDVSVWFPLVAEQPNKVDSLTRTLSEIISQEAALVVQAVVLRDHYREISRESFGWRVIYQSFDKTLTNEEVNTIQNRIVERLRRELEWEVR